MVYAAPPHSPMDAPLRSGHRRSRSHTIDTSEPTTSTAFARMTPPRRKAPRKGFFIDEDESPSPQDEDGTRSPPHDTDATTSDAVPFPTDDAPFRPGQGASRPPLSPTPSSGSVILSSGRPLKSSLKSSASAPQISDMPMHQRTKSEPSTPSHKSVHFRDEDDLTEVKVYNRTGRPANLLLKPGEETETETEVESGFPFPRTGPWLLSPSLSVVAPNELPYDIDGAPGQTSAIPKAYPDTYANIHLEAISLPKTRPAALRGSVLVRNVSFEKQVAVRFTFDNWQTTSEVHCKYVVSLPGLPPPFPRSRTLGDAAADIANGPTWDRFSFSISLEDYVEKLGDRTIWLVTRYTAPGVGEWWDNNSHANYRVHFRRSSASSQPSVVTQQKSFVPPATLRSTPLSASFAPADSPRPAPAISPAYANTVLGGRLSSSPRGSPGVSPRDSPAGSPRVSPNGSPNSSDTERRAAAAAAAAASGTRSTKPVVSSTLGLGSRPALPFRPPSMPRSNSSPPVYSPNGGPQFFTPAPRETARPAKTGSDGSGVTSPLMARLSKLALSNYARPAPVPASPEEHKLGSSISPAMSSIVGGQPATLDVPQLAVTEPSPPTVEPAFKEFEPKPSHSVSVSGPVPLAVENSPLSPDGVSTSTSTSGDSSPLVGTPPQQTSDLPSFGQSEEPLSPLWLPLKTPEAEHAPTPRAPRRQVRSTSSSSSGSDTPGDSGAHTPHRRPGAEDFVIDMPRPLARGSLNWPFSPVPTPRYSLDAALLGAGATGVDGFSALPARPRVGKDDPDYAAFIRQWCFARSPSPGTPAEGVPAAATPKVH